MSRPPLELFLLSRPGSNSFKHEFLDPPTQRGIQFQGDRVLKIKQSMGGSLCQAKYLFSKGLDIQYHALGYAARTTFKKGGVWHPLLRLI